MHSITFTIVCILLVLKVASANYKFITERKVTVQSPYKFTYNSDNMLFYSNNFLIMEITLKNIPTSVTATYLNYTMNNYHDIADPEIAQERVKVDDEIVNGEVKILIQKSLESYRNILVDVELQTREGVCYTSRVAEGTRASSSHDEFFRNGHCLVPKPCEIVIELKNQCEENFKCSFNATKYICTFNKRKMQKSQSYNLYQTYDIDGLRPAAYEYFRQGYDYIDAVDSFYKIHKIRKNWDDAKQECVKEGANLFYPENSAEANAVISFWRTYVDTIPVKTWMYVGISVIKSEGAFETIDGKSISDVYYKWGTNEPNNYQGKEDCVQMNQEGAYNDVFCSDKYSFICKKSLLSTEPHHSNGLRTTAYFRQGYDYIDAVDSFYKIHKVQKDWHDAKQECVKEGASLFYPENSAEANAVISFWRTYVDTTPVKTWMYVGISDIKNEGAFETIDGKSISEVYHKWKPNQPDNNNGNENCVHMNQEGAYNDIICSVKHNFICKKSLLPSEQHNLGSVIGVPLDSSAMNTKLIIDLELFDNNTSVNVETSVHKRDILWSDKIILAERDVVKENIVTLIYSEATDIQFSCEEYKTHSKYLSVALVNITENKIQTLNKTVINKGKFKMADNGSILCCLYYAYQPMNDGKEMQITRFAVNKTLLTYQHKELMLPKPADAGPSTSDTTIIIVSSVSASILVLLIVVYVLKKRYQRETNQRETSQQPSTQIPRQNSFSEIDPDLPFYQNMLFRRECELEIQAREEPQYANVNI